MNPGSREVLTTFHDPQIVQHDPSQSHIPTTEEHVNMAYVGDLGESGQTQLSCTSKEAVIAKDEDERRPECGISKCKPEAMQMCANLGCFTACYSIAALLTQTLNVYLTSQITSVEKQFGFSSSQVGVIMSGNDIGFLITVLFVSHFAKKAHIPRCLGGSTFLFGLSGLICCLIYFIDHTPKFLHKGDSAISVNETPAEFHQYDMETLVCNISADIRKMGSHEECSEKSVQTQASQTKTAFIMFMIGMLIQGVAKSPRTSLLTAYVDNNVEDKTKTGLYMGFITSMGIFGPSIAFLVGGVFSKIPVDLKDRGLSPRDPRWIGAWWMGFLAFGLAALVASLPIFFFPKRIKRDPDESDKQKIDEKKGSSLSQMKELPVSIWRVLKNPVYDLTILSICILLFCIAGNITFTPKYVEHQFTQPSWKTNFILGIEKVIGASTGTLLGGVFTSKLKLSRQGCIKLKLGIAFLAAGLETLGFVLGCPRPTINGISWRDDYDYKQTDISLNPTCQLSCHCPEEFYPVCGSNGMNYMSPCAAGCTSFNQTLQQFSSCQCIQNVSTASTGYCETDCPYLYPYIGNNLLKSFISTFAIVPGYIILLRSVQDEDKSIAIGMMSFLISLFGWLPGPIVFGQILDTTCVWWSKKCGITGECLFYDIKDMRIKIHAMTVSLRFVSGIVMVAALVAAYIEEKRLKKSGKNMFSQKMTFGEAKSKDSVSRASDAIELPQTDDRYKTDPEGVTYVVKNGKISGVDNNVHSDPMNTRL